MCLRAGPVLATRVVAEARRLVHVDPKSIDVYSSVFVEESGELIIPIVMRVCCEPVREDSGPWPDFTLPRHTGTGFQEGI